MEVLEKFLDKRNIFYSGKGNSESPYQYLSFNMKVMSFFGITKPDVYNVKNKFINISQIFPAFTLFNVSCQILVVQPLGIYDNLRTGKRTAIPQNLLEIFLATSALVRFATLHAQSGGISALVVRIEEMYQRADLMADKDDYQTSVLVRTRRMIKVFNTTVSVIWGVLPSVFGLLAVVVGYTSRKVDLEGYYPLGDNSPAFELTLLYIGMKLPAEAVLAGSCSLFVWDTLQLILGQYELLGHRIRHLRRTAEGRVAAQRKEGLLDCPLPLFQPQIGGEEGRADQLQGAGLFDSSQPQIGGDEGRAEHVQEALQLGAYRVDAPLPLLQPVTDVEQGRVVPWQEDQEEGRPKTEEVEEEMIKEAKECVGRHIELTGIVSEFSEKFSSMLTMQLLFNGIATGLITTYLASGQWDQHAAAVAGILFLVTIELLILCRFSSQIEDANKRVNQAFYECDWLSTSQKMQKNIYTMMVASSQSVHIQAFGFVDFSLPMFTFVMEKAYDLVAFIDTAAK